MTLLLFTWLCSRKLSRILGPGGSNVIWWHTNFRDSEIPTRNFHLIMETSLVKFQVSCVIEKKSSVDLSPRLSSWKNKLFVQYQEYHLNFSWTNTVVCIWKWTKAATAIAEALSLRIYSDYWAFMNCKGFKLGMKVCLYKILPNRSKKLIIYNRNL